MGEMMLAGVTDVVIIGAGQAGLASGQAFQTTGRSVLLIDAYDRIGDSWRSRWDSLRLFTPARHSALPGLPFPAKPGHYPGKDEVADYLEQYAAAFGLPVRHGTTVQLVRQVPGPGFEIVTNHGTFTAPAVVVATGPFQLPSVPSFATAISPEVVQLHSSAYRRPADLPDGPVLVIGGGNSGVQIAAELAATHPVTLAAGSRQPVLPQRILGVDVFTYLDALGVTRIDSGSAVGRRIRAREPLIGYGLRHLRREGVQIAGRVTGAAGRDLWTADGNRLLPASIVWATGFRPDFGWLNIAGAVGEDGMPLHRRGISPVEGLYYVGLPYQRSRGSALLGWVGQDAAYIATTAAGMRQSRCGRWETTTG